MSRLLARAYLTITVLALVAVTTFFFVRLSMTRNVQEETAAQRFEQLSTRVSEAWDAVGLPEAGNELSATLSENGPLVVGVYSFDRGIDYLWARDGRFLEGVPNVQAGMPQILSNDVVHRRFSRSFQLTDGSRRIITAVYPVLDGPAAYEVLRDTLVLFLAFVAAGLVVAIAHTVVASHRSQAEVTVVGPDRWSEADGRPEEGAKPSVSPDGTRAAGVTSPSETTPTPHPMEGDPDDDTDESFGLVPMDRLHRRLTLELERAGFHEQDISVAIFAFHHVMSDQAAHDNAQTVLSFFTFEDLCFGGANRRTTAAVRGRRSDDGDTQEVAVVFPSTSLAEALAHVERFQRFYWEERQNWHRPDADFHCGVTARNGRLVEADRIIRECRAALQRSHEAPGRIMGFQPDPQRYRAFLAGRSS